jgi:hypothetical protein
MASTPNAECFRMGMRVLRSLKHQGVRGEQRRIPGGTKGKNVQNGFCLHRDTHLRLHIERTLQAAHGKGDFHAKNVPVALLSSKMLGGKGLTLALTCCRKPERRRSEATVWVVKGPGLFF